MSSAFATPQTFGKDLQFIDTLELLSLCAEDTGNSAVWTEFLRRFTPKIKEFIRGTVRQSLRDSSFLTEESTLSGGFQESDLFQNTIVKLVENDCAALRRFTGRSEQEFLAYLAVISRSIVRDSLRRQRALKRPATQCDFTSDSPIRSSLRAGERIGRDSALERGVLAREVKELSLRALTGLEGRLCARDLLIFELYFFHDLSVSQVSQCQGIDLTKAGVQKVLDRLKDHVRSAADKGLSRAVV